ncbi:arylalkylamine N-acetyltransferase-like 2 isoform X3 [Penaeus japonicus]|uniref:arylalkylamine N-acetyltransferase-like 2 isoform X3 n=1 Tax=Penaeus japonicus TaxID=27405 RepID=UPI001C717B40|nr:arylalkylamine N-acetyltransferase-like 2 isoform X3 [Penaeus japonicus]
MLLQLSAVANFSRLLQMDRDKDIGYSLLTPEDFDQVTTFIDEDFLTREPLNLGAHPRNLGAHSTASSASGATGWYLTKCLASGVSFGARDFKTGALVGARLAYIKTKTDLADEESADEKKTELESRGLSVIEEVGSKVNLFQDPDVEKVLYMYLLSVRRDFCNRGIGTKLVQMTTERGKELGCQLAFATITNMLSGRIFLGLGYETRYTLDMSTPEGDRGFDLSAMEGNTMVQVMTKRLG